MKHKETHSSILGLPYVLINWDFPTFTTNICLLCWQTKFVKVLVMFKYIAIFTIKLPPPQKNEKKKHLSNRSWVS